MENTHLSQQAFSQLPLHDSLQESLEDLGFQYSTPIQAQSLPLALQGKDVAGQSQTGTGKTAAFLLAMLDYLMRNPVPEGASGPWAVILAPTRELAVQIHREACLLGQYTGLNMVAVYGGAGYDSQRRQLQSGADVVIGTPGRIIDFHKQKELPLNAIEVLVLDEADRMFDLGFINDIRYLLHRMPEPSKRLNLLFSATLSHRVLELAYEHMNSPERITVESATVTADNVHQAIYHVASCEKVAVLLGLLKQQSAKRGIIFVNTKAAGERLQRWLASNGHPAAVLSGDVAQTKRLRTIEQFQQGELPLLVATDVAARGLHVDQVDLVVNFDLPQEAADYVHRIGRTARIGAQGTALSLACEEYVFSLPDIEEYLGHKLPVEKIDGELLVDPKPPARREPNHNKPRRHHRKPAAKPS